MAYLNPCNKSHGSMAFLNPCNKLHGSMAFRRVSFGHDASASGALASAGRPFFCRGFSTPGIAHSSAGGFQPPASRGILEPALPDYAT